MVTTHGETTRKSLDYRTHPGRRHVLASLPGEVELGEPDAEDQWSYGDRLLRDKNSDGKLNREEFVNPIGCITQTLHKP